MESTASVQPIPPEPTPVQNGVLPGDVLLQIFALLPIPGVIACRKTCQNWKQASTHDTLWKALYYRQFGARPNPPPGVQTEQAFMEVWRAVALRPQWQCKLDHLVANLTAITTAMLNAADRGLPIPFRQAWSAYVRQHYALQEMGLIAVSRNLGPVDKELERARHETTIVSYQNIHGHPSTVALYLACQNNHDHIIRVLATAGCNLHSPVKVCQEKEGEQPFHRWESVIRAAIRNKRESTIQALFELGFSESKMKSEEAQMRGEPRTMQCRPLPTLLSDFIETADPQFVSEAAPVLISHSQWKKRDMLCALASEGAKLDLKTPPNEKGATGKLIDLLIDGLDTRRFPSGDHILERAGMSDNWHFIRYAKTLIDLGDKHFTIIGILNSLWTGVTMGNREIVLGLTRCTYEPFPAYELQLPLHYPYQPITHTKQSETGAYTDPKLALSCALAGSARYHDVEFMQWISETHHCFDFPEASALALCMALHDAHLPAIQFLLNQSSVQRVVQTEGRGVKVRGIEPYLGHSQTPCWLEYSASEPPTQEETDRRMSTAQLLQKWRAESASASRSMAQTNNSQNKRGPETDLGEEDPHKRKKH